MKVLKLYNKASTGKKSQSGSLYDISGISPTITAGTHGYSLGQILERESMRIRKLTPLECERLMSWENKIYNLEILLCEESVKNYVNAEEKNLKSPRFVGNVEKNELIKFVKHVEKYLDQKKVQRDCIVQENATLMIHHTKIEKFHQKIDSNLSVEIAERLQQKDVVKSEEDSAPLIVPINIEQGKIILNGKEELLPSVNDQIHQKNGQTVVKLYGHEIMQLVNDVKNDIITMNDHIMFTTLYHLGTKNLDMIRTICYYCAKNVIGGYIQNKIQIKNILLKFQIKIGHTELGNYNGIIKELSDTQRYKICGNGIVSKVSRHIVTYFLPEGEYRVFSTFSGADGSCLLLPERFKKIAFAEFDPKSKIQHPSAVLKYHHPEVPNLGDMTKIVSSEVPEFDVMFTSPPCQSFSISGKRLGFEDTRGTLFHEVARIIKDHPECKYLIFENVPGMLSHDKGNTFRVILETFSELGFSLDFDLFNAKDFGIPQNRSRLFLVGKRD